MAEEAGRLGEVGMDFPVQTYDIDFAGVVSNIVYIRWLEDLRLKILEVYYPLQRLLDAGLAPTLVETRIKYQQPITIRDQVSARMWISQVRRLKFGFQAEIYANGELAATAEQTGCLIEQASGRPLPLPEDFRRALSRPDRG